MRDGEWEGVSGLKNRLAAVVSAYAEAQGAAAGVGGGVDGVSDAQLDSALGSLIPPIDDSAKAKVRCAGVAVVRVRV